MSILCRDSDGNLLKSFYQWDVNQAVVVSGFDAGQAPVFHFCTKCSQTAYVVSPTTAGSGTNVTYTAIVPNILLQQTEPLVMYLYQEGNNNAKTVYSVCFPINPRPKPAGYVYSNNQEYISLVNLSNQLNTFLETAVDGLTYLNGNLYLTSNSVIVSDPVAIMSGGQSSIEEVFFATYGETSFAEIYNAATANKIVVARYGYLYYSLIAITSSAATFSNFISSSMRTIQCTSDDSWFSATTVSYITTENFTPERLGSGYATCTDSSLATNKNITLEDYKLVTGGYVTIKFTYALPANASLNINSRGSKDVFYRGAAIIGGTIQAGDIATFIYDGDHYVLLNVDRWGESSAARI